MKNEEQVELLKKAVKEFGSQRAVGVFLGVSDGQMTKLMKGPEREEGGRPLQAIQAARLAEKLGMRWIDHVLPILAGLEPLQEDRDYWLGKAGRLAQTGALVGVAALTGLATNWTHCIKWIKQSL
ncbi:MAG: hypothetical protein JWQ90_2564 [Hydrocarboniphaga sp.]|uniref:hypothetical protein n=1 Tax=Hydrocarboniphaga sp. TaxID=2033016 RepID=UPI0026077884|nr:hypothetical protein [Hydrocarboniphaga sp.]MDB5970114.1 hypothetical protein [Hydrocarboniphaga sp.]